MNPLRKAVIGGTLLAATVAGGAVGATLVGSAGAAESTTSSTAPAATAPAAGSATAPPQGQRPQGPHQANGITEELLTGDTATKVTEAAKAAVPGGTIERVETDAEGATYEAHVTKSDGSQVTVKLDDAFKVTGIEQGHA